MTHSVLYTDYVARNSPAWRAKKEQVFWRRGQVCEACKVGWPVDVHHMTYKRLGRERLSDLMVLCRRDHDRAHRLRHRTALNLRLCTYIVVAWVKLTRPFSRS